MTALKNLALILLFIILGIALGVGIYLAQHTYLSTRQLSAQTTPSTGGSTTQKTVASQPAPTYRSDSLGLSFSLPSSYSVVEDTLPGSAQGSLLTLVTKGNAATVLHPVGVTLYVLEEDALTSSQLLSQKQLLRRLATTDLHWASQPATDPAVDSFNIKVTWTAYTDPEGDPATVYEGEVGNDYLFITHLGSQMKDSEFSQLASSLTSTDQATNSPSATSSPISSSASPLLNQ